MKRTNELNIAVETEGNNLGKEREREKGRSGLWVTAARGGYR